MFCHAARRAFLLPHDRGGCGQGCNRSTSTLHPTLHRPRRREPFVSNHQQEVFQLFFGKLLPGGGRGETCPPLPGNGITTNNLTTPPKIPQVKPCDRALSTASVYNAIADRLQSGLNLKTNAMARQVACRMRACLFGTDNSLQRHRPEAVSYGSASMVWNQWVSLISLSC